MQRHKWFALLAAVAGLLLIIGPHTVFEVCSDSGKLMTLQNGMQAPMRCEWTAGAAQGIGGLILLMGLVLWFRRDGLPALSPTLLGAGLLVLLLPLYLVPTCPGAQMPCNLELKPALLGIGAVLAVVAAVAVGLSRRAAGGKPA